MSTVNDEIKKMITAGIADTSAVAGLSRQIIAQTNAIFGNVLIDFSNLANNTGLVLPTGGQMNPVLQPGAKASLRAVLAANPSRGMNVNSAYRTVAQQHVLYQLYVRNTGIIDLAARPGFSNHEDGMALDIQQWQAWKSDLENNDWRWQGGNDPVHFSYRFGNNNVGEMGVKGFQSLWNKYNPQDQIDVDGDFGAQTAARMNNSPAKGFASVGLFRKGDQSPSIAKISQALINAGASISVTNTFDNAMEAAVIAFQKSKGLAADGVVGPKTLAMLGVKLP
jgi:Putative peptidoglycan binding domain/D-alanyl-D-alanine carboxypeptidase